MSIPRRFYNVLRGYINREWERIQDAESNAASNELQDALDQPRPARTPEAPALPADSQARARRILGVAEDAGFGEIRRAYERLSRRSEPENFPTESADSRRASEIRIKIQWAYTILSENVDPTEKRFRSLEVD
ncbi:MAG: hypothetical protein WAO58_08135 [Fimbriimonadaceae bacterium]